MYYPPGAGGKFLINSLGLSRHMVPNDVDWAIWDLQQTVHDHEYYNKKLQTILRTVPDAVDDPKWQQYELNSNHKWRSPDSEFLSPIIENQTKSWAVVVHTLDQVRESKKAFPNSFVVKLSNYSKWLRISQFKMLSLSEDINNKIDYWTYVDHQEIQGEKFFDSLFDVDHCYTNLDRMRRSVEELYHQLGFDDFQYPLWVQYYIRYLSSHKKIDRF